VMEDVLGVQTPLPMTCSFQAHGFSSLMLGKLTTRLRRACGYPGLAATAVYMHPTARQLSIHVEENCKSSRTEKSQALVPHMQVWKGGSSTSLLSWMCMTVGLLVQCLVTEFASLPAYYILFWIYLELGQTALLLALGPVMMADQVLTLLVHVCLKWLIIGRRREGNHPVWGSYYWRWWF
ncbi:unnamed protein product, partial [Polarella glacialis]